MRNNEPMTLDQIAEHYGVSHQAISEIITRAMKKIRRELKNRGIRLEDLV